GTGSHVSYDNEVIEVSFADEHRSLYATDALLVLTTHSALFRELVDALKQGGPQDFKTLLRISMILENGTPRQHYEALAMATVNEQVLRFATTPFSSRLELSIPQDRARFWEKGAGR